jgi:hypothetical protein
LEVLAPSRNGVVWFWLLGISMKILGAALSVLNAGILVSSAVPRQSQTVEQPRFQVEIQPMGEGAPRYKVTNLTGKTVTACVLRLSSSSERKEQLNTDWDALLQDEPPMESGASISQYLSHVVGRPLPDKIEVVAGVWADGETFGQPDWVKVILKNREMQASAYEQAAIMLQQGLDQNWTRDQYLQALGDKPNSGPIYAIRSTLVANQQFAEKPKLLRHAMQMMLESFTQKYEKIRKVKPTASVATSSWPPWALGFLPPVLKPIASRSQSETLP